MVVVATFVGAPLIGALLGQLFTAVKEAVNKASSFEPILNRIKFILKSIIPIMNEIKSQNKVLDRPIEETGELEEIIEEGIDLVNKCSTVPLHQRAKYAEELTELEKRLKLFFQIVMQAQQTRDGKETLIEVKDLVFYIRRMSMNNNIGGGGGFDFQFMGSSSSSSAVPGAPPEYTVGLDMPFMELKKELLQFKDESSGIVLTAPPGCGKTTLAKMLCSDEEVKGKFDDNIFFVTVSKTPDLKVIVQRLFHQCKKEPEFINDEDAINQLEQLLRQIGPNPILLVLDDVWSTSEFLIKKFKFRLSNYKILLTSRFEFPSFGSTHRLKTLNDEDAMTLFHHFAFRQDRSSDIPNDLVKKIVKGCKRFPLALKVVGSSLCGRALEIWMEWAEGVSIFESDSELLDCLKSSLDDLDSKIKECYLDLGSFPEDQRIPATALIDMWVELYNLNENGVHAIANLHKLSDRNMLDLVVTRKDASAVDGFYNEHFVRQHDILKELVIYQSSSEHIEQRKRLLIDISGNNFPDWWSEGNPRHISARFLSISTDETFSSSWHDMQPPEVEVLVLNFQTKKYTLPEFMEKMDKLKVLIVTNYGFFRAELGNFPLLSSLSNLKRLRLENVSIPSLSMTRNLRKISLVMCNIGQAFGNLDGTDALPNLVEIDIDYCNDLVELPGGICNILPLKKLGITNCHKLSSLPNDIGRLENLEVLRLSFCDDLPELPDTIVSLYKLSFLDISECLNISKLPSHFGELHSLRKLYLRGCQKLELSCLSSIQNIEHLQEVRCDGETALKLDLLGLGHLTKVVKEDSNLNFLHAGGVNMNENIGGAGYEPVDFQFMGSSAVPWAPPPYTVGLDVPFGELKMELLEVKAESSVIVLTAPGGCGKTTLANMLCGDDKVKGKFKNNIFFVTVSKTPPDLKVIVRRLFHQCNEEPEFLDNENAIYKLGQLLSQRATVDNVIGPKPTNPILLVLDDVWPESKFPVEKFSFQLPDYKILVTSRFLFPGFGSSHCLKPLNDEYATTLFRHFAFLQDGSSDIPNDLVKKIVKGCKRFPLALKVVGSSLRGKAPAIWQRKVMEWNEGVSILKSEDELLVFLKGSLDDLDSKVKECYMDLGSFPEDQRIPATALIDMWAELYNLNENGVHAIANIHELSYRNLLNLVVTRKDASEVDGFYNEHFVMQHDILRELVIYLNQSSSERIEKRTRLFIETSGNNFPNWWLEQKPQHISARLLSISTDETFSSSWCDMQLSKLKVEVEVLVLNFRTKKYTLPEFMEKMDKLKVLIVTNYGFSPAELGNFTLLGSLPNLKRLRLENVSIPSLSTTTLQLRNLRKISLVMCNIGQAFSNLGGTDALPNLVEIDIDYCNDLVELPGGLCNIPHLKKLSITNCHKLSALPNDVGRLENLEVLRLSSCTKLLGLPDTIGSLSNLSFLDISYCLSISTLPSQFGELHSLRKLCMRGCSICELPPSIMDLEQLEEVRCDEETALLWEPFQLVLENTRIEVLKECHVGLDFLEDVSEIEKQETYEARTVVKETGMIPGACGQQGRKETSQGIEPEIVQIQDTHAQSHPSSALGQNDMLTEISLEATIQNGMVNLSGGRYGIRIDRTLNTIVECIKSSDIGNIGIYGRAGVGKTTVMEALKDLPEIRSMFDHVIWLTIPKTWNPIEVKTLIARQLSFSEIDDKHKEAAKFVFLLKRKKFLLILDDVVEHINLEMVGIPKPIPENGSKIILTTRSEQVCEVMAVDVKMRLEDLLSWELFCQNVGEVVDSFKIQPIAKPLVEMCRHYSHAIILMAGALKDVSDVDVWKNALEWLTPQAASYRENLENLLIDVLKFSCERLADDTTKKCLRYCAQHCEKEEIVIESLIHQWIADGLVDTHLEGNRIVQNLINANLLESVKEGVFVKLQNIDRHVLVNSIIQPEEGKLFLMLGGLGLTEPPKEEEWENAKEIHLMYNELSKLPENPRCPMLSALFLQRNYKLRLIPPSFFDYMPALEVLNLSSTRIRSLPESLFSLVSLKRLFLNDCRNFMMLSPRVGELKQLEVLDLEGTEIMDLPREMKNLTRLKCLEVSLYGHANDGRRVKQSNAMVHSGIISALSEVEELNIDVKPDDERWDACVEAIVNEVCSLMKLSALKFYFPRVELLSHFEWNSTSMVFPLLSKFRFIVGDHVRRIMTRLPPDVEFELERWDRCLKYVNGVGVPGEIKKVLGHATAFHLDRHTTVKKLTEFGIENLEHLKCCVVGECNEIQVIIDAADFLEEDDSAEIVPEFYGDRRTGLQSLEFLYVYYMKNLRTIWEGPLQMKCLTLLKSLTLCTCPQLTTIFTRQLLHNLCNLEELTVEDCPAITSIVRCETSAEHNTAYFLPKLRKISLHCLPELTSISSGIHIAPKLEWMSFYYCPNLKSLAVEEVSSKDLKKIKGESSWWDALERGSGWQDYFNGIFLPVDICD